MFRVFNGEGHPRADPAPHHVPGSGSTGHGSHRHGGTVPEIIRRLALRRHVRGQRFPLSAPVRDPGEERIGHPRCGTYLRGRQGGPRAFRTDNGTECTNLTFAEYYNSLRILRELMAPYTPQRNGPVKSGFSCAIKAGHAARTEVNKLFPDVHFERPKGVRVTDGSSLWMESVLWASEGLNRSATTANSGMLSSHKVILWGPPADVGFAVLQAGVPSPSAAE